jgi:ATP12 chaperone protein
VGAWGAQANSFQVLIQGRVLRTNGLRDLVIPSKLLAMAIAAEFGRQQGKINPAGTPLYNIVSHAIDTYAEEDAQGRVRREALEARMLRELNRRAATVLGDATASAEAKAAAKQVALQGLKADPPLLSQVLGCFEDTAGPSAGETGLTSLVDTDTAKLRAQLKDYLGKSTETGVRGCGGGGWGVVVFCSAPFSLSLVLSFSLFRPTTTPPPSYRWQRRTRRVFVRLLRVLRRMRCCVGCRTRRTTRCWTGSRSSSGCVRRWRRA